MSFQPRPFPLGDTLYASKNPIRIDFESIQTDYEEDHSPFNPENDNFTGKHQQSTYREYDSATGPTTLANESTIWGRVGPASGKTDLFIRRENNAGALLVPTRDLQIFGVSAAGLFDNTGSPQGKHNLNVTASRESNAQGIFTCKFQTALSHANYMIFAWFRNNENNSSTNVFTWKIKSKSASQFVIIFTRTNSGQTGNRSNFDPSAWNVMVYGGT